ncbi:hypothetical protein SAMN04488028_10523 [Reichenbachiella agariperforans]|uniref:Uncharacterized protein n=1 Tax=Reichenbachiella agariperforans TaxID=156994 RepID=A0A1M6SHJ4_REIAG|nr:DUF6029 family protein [Reichenbachiella agariperforans]SHK44203.1 hypothetical protein SAMN04488028_10523 [Reichenbachiella agariperforans]
MNRFLLILLLIITTLGTGHAQGTLRGSNLMEYQLGNIPELTPRYQSSLFDQLDLSYRYKSFGLDARVEQYYPSFGDDISYTRVSQFKFQYRAEMIDIQVGNLYESFGRGLLLRTYEIPGSIWETRGYRVRYGFYRDLLGAAVKFNYKNAELKLIRGEVLDVTLPPTVSDDTNRRPDLVEGAEASYRLGSQKVGLIYMRHHTESQSIVGSDPAQLLSAYYDGVLFENFSLYGELAKSLNDNTDLTDFSDQAAYAGYVGLSFYFGNLGASLEYKNYHNFSLGAGINDPPTLVKEHSYRLLNRSTHIPVLTDESGYQVELYYSFEDGSILTFNTSRASNEISETIQPVFKEYFLEYQFYPIEKLSIKAFADYAEDPFRGEPHRYAGGSYIDWDHPKLTSSIEFEYQQIERDADPAHNYYIAYTLAKPSKFSASVVLELTTDPFLLVEPSDDFNAYPAFIGTYRPNTKNTITLFAGKRRGGPACNSGVCYDVLSFEGVELRLNTRF